MKKNSLNQDGIWIWIRHFSPLASVCPVCGLWPVMCILCLFLLPISKKKGLALYLFISTENMVWKRNENIFLQKSLTVLQWKSLLYWPQLTQNSTPNHRHQLCLCVFQNVRDICCLRLLSTWLLSGNEYHNPHIHMCISLGLGHGKIHN